MRWILTLARIIETLIPAITKRYGAEQSTFYLNIGNTAVELVGQQDTQPVPDLPEVCQLRYLDLESSLILDFSDEAAIKLGQSYLLTNLLYVAAYTRKCVGPGTTKPNTSVRTVIFESEGPDYSATTPPTSKRLLEDVIVAVTSTTSSAAYAPFDPLEALSDLEAVCAGSELPQNSDWAVIEVVMKAQCPDILSKIKPVETSNVLRTLSTSTLLIAGFSAATLFA